MNVTEAFRILAPSDAVGRTFSETPTRVSPEVIPENFISRTRLPGML